MRKLFWIFFVLQFAKAQEAQKQVFSLKPTIGLNAAQVHGDSYSGFHKAGIFGGLAVNAALNKRTSIEMGFYFSQKGARHNPNPAKNDFTSYYLNLNYVDLPLLLRFHLNKDYFVTLGPSVAYLASYYESINSINYTGTWHFEQFEYGANFGFGKKLGEKWTFEVRTSNSFLPIRAYGNNILSTVFYPNPLARFFNKGFYNNVITFIGAYRFDLKRKTNAAK